MNSTEKRKVSYLSEFNMVDEDSNVIPRTFQFNGTIVFITNIDFDAIIPRIKPSATFYGCALTRHFESMGVYTLNSASAIRKSRDKLFALQLLINNGLPIPTTGFANSPLDTAELINMVGGAPLIVKLLEGTQGKGVVLAETRKAASSST